MPLISLSLEAGRTREQRRQLDAVYKAQRGAIQIPESVGDLLADPGVPGRGAAPASGFCRDHAATWTASEVTQYVDQEQRGRDQREWEQNDHEHKASQKQAGR